MPIVFVLACDLELLGLTWGNPTDKRKLQVGVLPVTFLI
jgi:hypothetical protein